MTDARASQIQMHQSPPDSQSNADDRCHSRAMPEPDMQVLCVCVPQTAKFRVCVWPHPVRRKQAQWLQVTGQTVGEKNHTHTHTHTHARVEVGELLRRVLRPEARPANNVKPARRCGNIEGKGKLRAKSCFMVTRVLADHDLAGTSPRMGFKDTALEEDFGAGIRHAAGRNWRKTTGRPRRRDPGLQVRQRKTAAPGETRKTMGRLRRQSGGVWSHF